MNSTNPLANARTLLFVPGNRPERFDKALASNPDAVVLDLEDSVPVAEKENARHSIGGAWKALRSQPVPIVLRINPPATDAGRADLTLLRSLDSPAAVMVPKAESAEALASVRAAAPASDLLPLIESAAGLEALATVASALGVLRLVIGHIDFMADTGINCSPDERELDPLRFAVAMQTRLRNLSLPIDGVTTAFADDDRLRSDVARAMRFGFGGKLCIHPRQVPVVHACMLPSSDEIAWAQRVMHANAAASGAAVQLNGRMIDLPVVLQARRTLDRFRHAESD
jgi:citrate lyase subunit beta/citryl-CoA lyase